jgi:uncharacterized membrane protein YcaP (DUF421 family)
MDWLGLIFVALRTSGLYFGLLVAMRIVGKRKVGQMAPSDIIVLLLIGDAAQNAMTGGETSFWGSIVAVFSLLLTDHVVAWLTFRFRWLEQFIEGRPLTLYRDNAFDDRTLRKEKITRQDLATALRAHGCDTLDGVREIVLEPNGMVSLLKEAGPDKDEEHGPPKRPKII